MFEEFSAGYWIGRLYVEPHDGEHAVMDSTQHEAANEQIYATGDGVERVDYPLVMKVDDHHFPVFGADDVPADTVAVPDEVLDATRGRAPPTLTEVLVAKADRALRFLAWWTPYSVDEPNYA